jgi:hypothetical protein
MLNASLKRLRETARELRGFETAGSRYISHISRENSMLPSS